MLEIPDSEESGSSFKAILQEKVEDKLSEHGDHYAKEAQEWADRIKRMGLSEQVEIAPTPENAARRDAVVEIMVEQYYGKEIDGADLIIMGEVPGDINAARPRLYKGTDREALIEEIESIEVDGAGGLYKDGSNFFVINKTDSEFNPIEGQFEARHLREKKSEQ